MRVLVCGGRTFHNVALAVATLDGIHAETPISEIISGASKGADRIGEYWARLNKIRLLRFPADWKRYGNRAAGPIRNRQMLDEGKPDLVVAFPGGKGTRNMVRQAFDAGVKILEIRTA